MFSILSRIIRIRAMWQYMTAGGGSQLEDTPCGYREDAGSALDAGC